MTMDWFVCIFVCLYYPPPEIDDDDDEDVLTLAHFPEIYPAVTIRLQKSVFMEGNRILRAPQYQYAREWY